MFSLISDLGSYIWLALIVTAVLATYDTGEAFGYNALASAFAAMLCGLFGVNFYLQFGVFFTIMVAMSIVEKALKGKTK